MHLRGLLLLLVSAFSTWLIFGATGCAGRKATSGPQAAAQQFFDLVAKGEMRRAYESASFGFRAQQTFSNFDAVVKELGLSDQAKVDWTTRSEGRTETTLEGELTNKAETKLRFVVLMIKEDGAWKLHSLLPAQAGAVNKFTGVGKDLSFSESYNTTVPPDSEMRAMIRQTLLGFDQALKQGTFTMFYATISKSMQEEVELERFQRSFQPFIEKKADLAGIKDVELVWTRPPRLKSAGILEVGGYYPAKPHKVHFALTYKHETADWKLLAIEVSLTE